MAPTSEPVVIGSLLFGADDLVAELVRSRIPHMRGLSWGDFTSLGVISRGHLVGGVVYHCWRGFDIQFGAAFDVKNWATRGTLRALFNYPFNQLGCVRVTAITARKNKKARSMLSRLGFEFEGVMKRGLDGVQDGFVYAMQKDKCKWIKDTRDVN